MHNGALLTNELVKLAEETESDETQMQKNLNAIDGCAGLRNKYCLNYNPHLISHVF